VRAFQYVYPVFNPLCSHTMDPYENNFITWNNLATEYEQQFMDLSLYDDTYDLFCGLIKKKSPAIFEIGCGPGNITRYLLTKRPDFRLHAIDIAPNMVRLAQLHNPTATVSIMDCRDLHSFITPFEGIVIGFCIPYLSIADCSRLVAECARLLPADGILYLSTPESDAEGSEFQASSDGKTKMYVSRYSAKSIKELLDHNHFETVHVVRKSYTRNNGAAEVHQVFLARKKRINRTLMNTP